MIAVVVLTHGRVHLLRQCVENVLARTSELTTEIVIWDNASTDGTAAYLDSLDDSKIRIVHHSRNIGQSAYADAFRMTSAPYMIELDDDVVDAPPEWDRTLLEAFVALPQIGFLAPNIADNPHDQLAKVMRERAHLYSTEESNGILLLRGPVGGACAMTSRELNERVGGFRKNRKQIFWLEDAAYIEDIAKLGYSAAYLHDLRITHAGGPYYSSASAAKDDYWRAYWQRINRKNAVKKALLRVPLARRLNNRYRWFDPSETPN